MISDDFRKLMLLDWLENDLLLAVSQCEPASSDASFRRYFRVTLPGQQLIVMDAPPEKENIRQFVKVARLMAASNVKVPAIYHENLTDGFLVLEDFGSQAYQDKLNQENVESLYANALDSLFSLQTNTDIGCCDLPAYDEALLARELGIFEEWLIRARLDLEMPAALWDDVCAILIRSALEQPQTCVHRDYHSRNLMVLTNHSPGVIDFQDAVIGPISYDLVSLLRDCYIAWPQAQVARWLEQYYQRLINVGLITCELATFTRWFDLMGMQRHLKAIGIFSRLDLRDNKSGYLKDIPRTLNYVIEQCRSYDELNEFSEYLTRQLLPHFPHSQ
jgi:aminoglycoside/choline kinase family phosphotransferase